MNYLKYPQGISNSEAQAQEIARPLTPKSERQRSTWGSLAPMSLQTTQGLCRVARKCVRKEGHAGDCWPS